MEIAYGHAALPRRPKRPVIAVGNFDGVHVGHQRIFQIAREQARAQGGEAVVLTFDPHPAKVLAPELAPPLICPLAKRLERIAACGVDLCVVETFDAELAAMSPEAFVDEILVFSLRVREVVVGRDFTYGRGRAGTIETLLAAGQVRGFGLSVVEKVAVAGLVASSSKVREFVLEGRVDGAARLLGRPFEIVGTVISGAGRGRTLGIPTANLKTDNELLPRTGVYAGALRSRGERRDAVINVGVNPTFTRGDTLSIEAHVLGFEGDLYGQEVALEFLARLRGEQRFPDANALVAQIRRDMAAAQEFLTKKGT
jgi:riboflavin kinase/FMN adenylyltransferase